MTANWTEIKNQVSAFRNYLKNIALPGGNSIAKKYSFVISANEIEKLLIQKKDGSRLDGIRVYLAADAVNGQIIPTIHVIACKISGKDSNGTDEHYEDYNVPVNDKELNDAIIAGTLPETAEAKPCPPMCSGLNILNS